MGRILGFFLMFLSVSAMASAPKCGDLAQDLKAMQEAQQQLLQSLGQKNQVMASVLEQNADKLEKMLASRRAFKKSDISSLRISARAFRGHEKREAVLIEKFQKASNELLEQVQSCLSNPDSIAKN